MVEDGRTPYLSAPDLQALGFSIALYPISSLLVVSQALKQTYADMLQAGRLPETHARISFPEYNEMIGLNDLVPSAV